MFFNPVVNHKFVGAAAFNNNVARCLTIYPVMLGKAFQSQKVVSPIKIHFSAICARHVTFSNS